MLDLSGYVDNDKMSMETKAAYQSAMAARYEAARYDTVRAKLEGSGRHPMWVMDLRDAVDSLQNSEETWLDHYKMSMENDPEYIRGVKAFHDDDWKRVKAYQARREIERRQEEEDAAYQALEKAKYAEYLARKKAREEREAKRKAVKAEAQEIRLAVLRKLGL